MGERVGRVSSHAVSRWSRSPGGCGVRGVFSVGHFFRVLFFSIFFFFEPIRPAASMRPSCLIYLSASLPNTLDVRTSCWAVGCRRPHVPGIGFGEKQCPPFCQCFGGLYLFLSSALTTINTSSIGIYFICQLLLSPLSYLRYAYLAVTPTVQVMLLSTDGIRS